MTELAYQTGLSVVEVIDALSELEEHGRVTPYAWQLGPEANVDAVDQARQC